MKICINEFGHMTNMATTPIYGKNFKKSFPEAVDQWPLNFACSIGYPNISKIIQMMTLDGP